MLCDRAEENPLLWKNPGIRAYVNGRLENGIRGALYRGEPDQAYDLAGFMMSPLTLKQRLYWLGMRLPTWFLSAGVSAYRRKTNYFEKFMQSSGT